MCCEFMFCVHVQCCALVNAEYKTNQTVMKATTWFSCEAIKKEKPNKVKCDADEIDIFNQQDHQLFVPPTSLLVAVASMTKQDGAFQTSASTCCTLLLMDLQDGKSIKEEKMSESLRDTSEPGTWCFALSSFDHTDTCLVSLFATLNYAFFCHLRSCLAFRTDCYGFTIPSKWDVLFSAFAATYCRSVGGVKCSRNPFECQLETVSNISLRRHRHRHKTSLEKKTCA